MTALRVHRVFLLVSLLALVALMPSPGRADGITFFSVPGLGAATRMVLNPYIDGQLGLTFTAVPEGEFEVEVGLVRSNATAVCIDPLDDDQMLGTAVAGSGEIGNGWFAIRVDFATPVVPPGYVAMRVQTVTQTNIHISLYDENGTEVGSYVGSGGSNHYWGNCAPGGYPYANQSGIYGALSITRPVSYAIIDTEPNAIFAIDNFNWRDHVVAVESTTWGRVKALYR